jgi:hypothetical protein
MPAARAVLPLLGADDYMTRLHAERALGYVGARWCGWRPGVESDAKSERCMQALGREMGSLPSDAMATARGAAILRWRRWIAAHATN